MLKLQRDPKVAELIILDFFKTESIDFKFKIKNWFFILQKGFYVEHNVDFLLLSMKEEIMNLSVTEDDKKLLEILFILNKDSENRISNFRY